MEHTKREKWSGALGAAVGFFGGLRGIGLVAFTLLVLWLALSRRERSA